MILMQFLNYGAFKRSLSASVKYVKNSLKDGTQGRFNATSEKWFKKGFSSRIK